MDDSCKKKEIGTRSGIWPKSQGQTIPIYSNEEKLHPWIAATLNPPIEELRIANVDGNDVRGYQRGLLEALESVGSGDGFTNIIALMKTKRKLVPKSAAVSSSAATGERNVVGQDGGANVSGGNPSVPFKRSCIRQSSSTPCLGQQSHVDTQGVVDSWGATYCGHLLSQSSHGDNVKAYRISATMNLQQEPIIARDLLSPEIVSASCLHSTQDWHTFVTGVGEGFLKGLKKKPDDKSSKVGQAGQVVAVGNTVASNDVLRITITTTPETMTDLIANPKKTFVTVPAAELAMQAYLVIYYH
ncbi:hypothetical protein Tco_0529167 [Tanacetum coccineum]